MGKTIEKSSIVFGCSEQEASRSDALLHEIASDANQWEISALELLVGGFKTSVLPKVHFNLNSPAIALPVELYTQVT